MKLLAIVVAYAAIMLFSIGAALATDPVNAVPPSCPGDALVVDPGEHIKLDATPATSPPDGTTVSYYWTFVDSGSNPYPIYVSSSQPLSVPGDFQSAILEFDAPTVPGDYYATLVLTYTRSSIINGETTKNCISVTCKKITVGPTECPLCDDEFCSNDYPTSGCPAVLSYTKNVGPTLTLKWFLDGTQIDTGPSTIIDWSPSSATATPHKLRFEIWRPSDTDAPWYYCEGNVNIVEQPTASIIRTS